MLDPITRLRNATLSWRSAQLQSVAVPPCAPFACVSLAHFASVKRAAQSLEELRTLLKQQGHNAFVPLSGSRLQMSAALTLMTLVEYASLLFTWYAMTMAAPAPFTATLGPLSVFAATERLRQLWGPLRCMMQRQTV